MNKNTAVCLAETLSHIRRVQEILSIFISPQLVKIFENTAREMF